MQIKTLSMLSARSEIRPTDIGVILWSIWRSPPLMTRTACEKGNDRVHKVVQPSFLSTNSQCDLALLSPGTDCQVMASCTWPPRLHPITLFGLQHAAHSLAARNTTLGLALAEIAATLGLLHQDAAIPASTCNITSTPIHAKQRRHSDEKRSDTCADRRRASPSPSELPCLPTPEAALGAQLPTLTFLLGYDRLSLTDLSYVPLT